VGLWGVGSLFQAIQYPQRPLPPAHENLEVHVAGFGALIGRGEKGQRGLLNLGFALRGLLGERLPQLIALEEVLG